MNSHNQNLFWNVIQAAKECVMRGRIETHDSVYFDPDDLEGIYEYLLSADAIQATEEMRLIVETHWPELVHKLVPQHATPTVGSTAGTVGRKPCSIRLSFWHRQRESTSQIIFSFAKS